MLKKNVYIKKKYIYIYHLLFLDCAAGRHVNFSIPVEAADRSDGTPRRWKLRRTLVGTAASAVWCKFTVKRDLFWADKILSKNHFFPSQRDSVRAICAGFLFNPAAQIVWIGEAWTRLACLKKKKFDEVIIINRVSRLVSPPSPAAKVGWRNVNSVQRNRRRKCSPCCKKKKKYLKKICD